MATHSSILAWRSQWTEKPGEPWSIGSQKVRHDWMAKHTQHRVRQLYGLSGKKYRIIVAYDLEFCSSKFCSYFLHCFGYKDTFSQLFRNSHLFFDILKLTNTFVIKPL